MESVLQSLSKFFFHKIYRIPDYQRGYAWTEKHLSDFWGDIVQLEDEKNHYVGVLTLESVPKKVYEKWEDDFWIIDSKSYEPYFIVDGQQRLTTSIILLQSILEVAKENFTPKGRGKKKEIELNDTSITEIRKQFIFEQKTNAISRSYLFGYEKDNPSYEFLKTKIFKEKSRQSYKEEETIYTQNLQNASNYFLGKLKELKDLPSIEKLYYKLTQRLLFNIYTISNDIDVFIAFETMNNRGKPLSTLELLKNRLIYLSTKLPDAVEEKSKLRREINDSWKSVYHNLGRNKDNPLDDDDFLKTHTQIFLSNQFSGNRQSASRLRAIKDNYQEYLLETEFTIKNIQRRGSKKLTLDRIYKYSQHLQDSVEVWYELNNPTLSKKFNDKEKTLLEKITRFGFNNLNTLFLLFYLTNPDKQLSSKFLEMIERLLFLSSFPEIHIPSTLKEINKYEVKENCSSKELFEFVANEISKMSYESDFHEYANEVLRIFNNEFRHFIAGKYSHKSKPAISIPEAVTTVDAMFSFLYSQREYEVMLQHYTRRLTYLSTNSFYKWRGIRYFLFEYEQHLRGKVSSKQQKINWAEFIDEKADFITIEHILPQTANLDCWQTKFAKYNKEEMNRLCNSLGNLLPLSTPKNSKLSNKCFETKVRGEKDLYLGYSFGSLSEIEVSQSKEWTAKEILIRGLKLVKFMEERWKINFVNNGFRLSFLKLNFVLEKENIKYDELDELINNS